MRKAGQLGPGFAWPVPTSCLPRGPPLLRGDIRLGGRGGPLAREHSLMLSVPAAGSPLPTTPTSSLETTLKE